VKILFLVLVLLSLSFYFVIYTSLGTNPSGERLTKIEQSIQYNLDKKQFQNAQEIPLATGRHWTSIFYAYFFNDGNRAPKEKLPENPPKLSELDIKSHEVRFIWFGHSTILLEINRKRILIDPVFSDYASPIPGIIKRFQPPVFKIDEVEDIDIVLISHDHYDHLDFKTIEKLRERDIQYLVPLGVGAHLEYWGIKKEKITELDWWEDTTLLGLKFTCAPAQHFSGRGMSNRNTTLWASWAIKGQKQNVFFSGDSGYSEHYKTIGDRMGPFDLAFLENGAYSIDWKFVHQLPEEGVQASIDLNAKSMIPIHWGMFDLALHSWHEPIERVTIEAKKHGVDIIAPKLGQLISTSTKYKQEDWWSELFIQNADTLE